MDRRAIPGQGRAGRRGLLLYADDLSDLDFAGALHGQRRAVFHPFRAAGRTGPAGSGACLLCADRGRGPCAERPCLCLPGLSAGLSPGAGTGEPPQAGIPDGDFLRERRFVPVQLLRVDSPGGGQFRGAACFSGGFRRAEYCAGPVVRAGAEAGRGRRGGGHGAGPVCVRRWHCGLHIGAVPPAPGHSQRLPDPLGLRAGDRQLFRPDLRAAVGDESGHPDGAGAGPRLGRHRRARRRARSPPSPLCPGRLAAPPLPPLLPRTTARGQKPVSAPG